MARTYLSVAITACAVISSASARGADAVSSLTNALGQLADASTVTFESLDIREIDTWIIRLPDGVLATGQTLKFEKNRHSAENLCQCLLAQERHARFVVSKKKTCDALAGQVQALQGKINFASEHIRHARMAGHQLGDAGVQQLQAEQGHLNQALQAELRLYADLANDHKQITGPVSQRYKQLLEAYAAGMSAIQSATPGDLRTMLDILAPLAVKDGGYAEAMLFSHAVIRNGGDTSPIPELLARHKEKLESSETMGFSPINMSRMTLSILCESQEDLSKSIAHIKRNKDSLKSAAITYTLGTWHESREQWSEAGRYYRMARAKVKEDARNRAIASASVVYCLWRDGKLVDLSDNEDMVGEVRVGAEMQANDASQDWQIIRGLMVLSSVEQDAQTAELLRRQAFACAPPRIQRTLNSSVIAERDRAR
jgi:hypothetical protein